MKNIVSISFLLIVLNSCNSNNTEEQQEEQYLKNFTEERNKAIRDSITTEYSVKYYLDTLNTYKLFTIDFSPILQTKFQLIENFNVVDIFEKDTSIYMNIEINNNYFNLSISLNQYNKIRTFINNKDDLLLVVSLIDVYKAKLKIDSECEDENEDGTCFESDIVMIAPVLSSFFGNGKLVEIIKLEK